MCLRFTSLVDSLVYWHVQTCQRIIQHYRFANPLWHLAADGERWICSAAEEIEWESDAKLGSQRRAPPTPQIGGKLQNLLLSIAVSHARKCAEANAFWWFAQELLLKTKINYSNEKINKEMSSLKQQNSFLWKQFQSFKVNSHAPQRYMRQKNFVY